ncbi:hypothetical protein [Alkaliphilus metalliredigens]|nr:hypothetical protein [Alkaliphilus metalliredigens]
MKRNVRNLGGSVGSVGSSDKLVDPSNRKIGRSMTLQGSDQPIEL